MNTNNEFLRITWEHVFQCYLLTLQYSVIMLFKVFFFSPCDRFSHKLWRARRAKRHEIENKVNLRPHSFSVSS